jgi:hypothetical protein
MKIKLIDRITLNRTIKILTDFILSILKIFYQKSDPDKPKPISPRKTPLRDLLNRWIKK